MSLWQRIRWRWMVGYYGPELALAWIALENFEKHHCRHAQRSRSEPCSDGVSPKASEAPCSPG